MFSDHDNPTTTNTGAAAAAAPETDTVAKDSNSQQDSVANESAEQKNQASEVKHDGTGERRTRCDWAHDRAGGGHAASVPSGDGSKSGENAAAVPQADGDSGSKAVDLHGRGAVPLARRPRKARRT